MSAPTRALMATLALGGCATPAAQPAADAFFTHLAALCGQRFAGTMTTSDPADAAFAGQTLEVHAQDCTPTRIALPFAVGADRSRTWIVTRTADGLRLKHDHRHADGTPDRLTNYGGDAHGPGTPTRQDFPADAESRALFLANDRAVAVDNVWTLAIDPGRSLTYTLQRPNRRFSVRFDLSRPLPRDAD
ncbi:MAG: hypothetical protein NW203_04940 [Hyphomonadaceae bacterium]|nr:hypothetical protein [Hyphomonadaceae bacterium]